MTLVETPSIPPLPADAPTVEPVRVPRPGRPWTEADLWALESDERHFELVRGDLLMMSPASPVQGRYAARLSAVLWSCVEDQVLGEVYVSEPGFKLQTKPEEIIRSPDVAFVRTERIPAEEDEKGFWALAPDLAVEIISPSESAAEMQEKVQDYLAAGTRLVWLVYPRTQTVMEYEAGGCFRHYGIDDSLDGGTVIPGFSYALRDLFRRKG